MKNRIISLLFALVLAMSALTCLAEAAPVPDLPRSQAALSMMAYLEEDPELMALMEKSIAKAREINPDPNTNPVDSVDELYDFIDWFDIFGFLSHKFLSVVQTGLNPPNKVKL